MKLLRVVSVENSRTKIEGYIWNMNRGVFMGERSIYKSTEGKRKFL